MLTSQKFFKWKTRLKIEFLFQKHGAYSGFGCRIAIEIQGPDCDERSTRNDLQISKSGPQNRRKNQRFIKCSRFIRSFRSFLQRMHSVSMSESSKQKKRLVKVCKHIPSCQQSNMWENTTFKYPGRTRVCLVCFSHT
jgi:hypothetical protein